MNKDKLIEALAEERKKFFLKGWNTADHDAAVVFLKTGKIPDFYMEDVHADDYPLLYAAINDFEQLCSDYDIK